MQSRGWIGDPELVLYVLRIFRADQDEAGKFLVYGDAPITGLTGEMVVSPNVEVSFSGKRVPLVSLLAETSYGTHVTVF